jgi:hypothetical protein
MSGLNCAACIYATQNVHATEILHAVSCESCFISEEYTVATEEIFTALLMEPLEQFLAWVKINWTSSLYPLQVVWV